MGRLLLPVFALRGRRAHAPPGRPPAAKDLLLDRGSGPRTARRSDRVPAEGVGVPGGPRPRVRGAGRQGAGRPRRPDAGPARRPKTGRPLPPLGGRQGVPQDPDLRQAGRRGGLLARPPPAAARPRSPPDRAPRTPPSTRYADASTRGPQGVRVRGQCAAGEGVDRARDRARRPRPPGGRRIPGGPARRPHRDPAQGRARRRPRPRRSGRLAADLPAGGRHRKRQDGSLPGRRPAVPRTRTKGHRARPRDRADPADDRALRRQVSKPGRRAPQRVVGRRAVRPVVEGAAGTVRPRHRLPQRHIRPAAGPGPGRRGRGARVDVQGPQRQPPVPRQGRRLRAGRAHRCRRPARQRHSRRRLVP